MAKNIDVIKAFINGNTKSVANLRSERGYDDVLRLVNYSTTLAELHPDGSIIVNVTSYSSSTSRIQNMLKNELGEGYTTIDNVYQGKRYLK